MKRKIFEVIDNIHIKPLRKLTTDEEDKDLENLSDLEGDSTPEEPLDDKELGPDPEPEAIEPEPEAEVEEIKTIDDLKEVVEELGVSEELFLVLEEISIEEGTIEYTGDEEVTYVAFPLEHGDSEILGIEIASADGTKHAIAIPDVEDPEYTPEQFDLNVQVEGFDEGDTVLAQVLTELYDEILIDTVEALAETKPEEDNGEDNLEEGNDDLPPAPTEEDLNPIDIPLDDEDLNESATRFARLKALREARAAKLNEAPPFDKSKREVKQVPDRSQEPDRITRTVTRTINKYPTKEVVAYPNLVFTADILEKQFHNLVDVTKGKYGSGTVRTFETFLDSFIDDLEHNTSFNEETAPDVIKWANEILNIIESIKEGRYNGFSGYYILGGFPRLAEKFERIDILLNILISNVEGDEEHVPGINASRNRFEPRNTAARIARQDVLRTSRKPNVTRRLNTNLVTEQPVAPQQPVSYRNFSFDNITIEVARLNEDSAHILYNQGDQSYSITAERIGPQSYLLTDRNTKDIPLLSNRGYQVVRSVLSDILRPTLED